MSTYRKEDGLLPGVTVYRRTESSVPAGKPAPEKRVAAYCRVSTDLEIQASSLALQTEAYLRIIAEHPGWTLAGIYADQGLSGTRTANRAAFNRMMEDARGGAIDVILAKSLSRFARNTVDALQYTRELKDIGVTVYFEKERIDSANASSEFLLTIFAAFAQEEAHSISENTKRGIRNRFRMGQPRYCRIFGYDSGWTPNGDARTVQTIFSLALDGCSKREIARQLNEAGIPSPAGGSSWSPSTVLGILRNEKYTGDALMQKTFTGDYIRHNKVYNRDLLIDSYYKEDHHEGIIRKEDFAALRFETNLKRGKYGADQTPYYGLLRCSACGRTMIRIPGIYTEKRPMWVCPGNDKTGTLDERRTCEKLILLSPAIDRALIPAVNEISAQTQDGERSDFTEALAALKNLLQRTGHPSYCRAAAVIRRMVSPDGRTLTVEWKNGQTATYALSPSADAEALWPAVAKAHIETVPPEETAIHKVNHPYRRKQEWK